MEVDERERDGCCPTDVVSNESEVEATLSVLIAAIAEAYCIVILNEVSETPNV